MLVRLKAHTDAVFSSQTRQVMQRPYADLSNLRILAIGESFTIDEDEEVSSDNMPVIYGQDPLNDLFYQPIPGASLDILEQTATKFFSFFGSDALWKIVVDHERDLLAGNDQHRGSTVAAFPFGIIMMSPAPYSTLADAAQSQDGVITAEMVATRFRVILDAELSSHQKIQAIEQAKDFLNLYFRNDADLENYDNDQKMVHQFMKISVQISS
jgi:hypothetical protein